MTLTITSIKKIGVTKFRFFDIFRVFRLSKQIKVLPRRLPPIGPSLPSVINSKLFENFVSKLSALFESLSRTLVSSG